MATIVQQKGYYSFGMEISQFSSGTGSSKNWYNGKEIQDDFGLYWYDYGARFYDPQLGRWHSLDPSAEQRFSFSPYNFCSNNPIIRIDSDGALDDIVITGANNSSVTLETDLIDVEVDASSLGLNFGGNYSLAGEDVLSAGLDIVGIVDPSGVADGLNASLQAKNGQWGGAIISGIGLVPYIGDLAKVGKVGKDVKTINKAIDALKSSDNLKAAGRSGKQERLRELANDPKVSSADRGWIKNEKRHIENGNRKTIRNPGNSRNSTGPGKVLAHPKGQRAKDGHSYKNAKLQDTDLHKLEHKYEGY